MTPLAWLALLHPVLIILFVYPVVGATIRLGILVREHRLGITVQPAPVPREHASHGLALTLGALLAVLIALAYDAIARPQPSPFAGPIWSSHGWAGLLLSGLLLLTAAQRSQIRSRLDRRRLHLALNGLILLLLGMQAISGCRELLLLLR